MTMTTSTSSSNFIFFFDDDPNFFIVNELINLHPSHKKNYMTKWNAITTEKKIFFSMKTRNKIHLNLNFYHAD